jgi:hypothetical protein
MKMKPWYGPKGGTFKNKLLKSDLILYKMSPRKQTPYFQLQEGVVDDYEYVLIRFIVREDEDGRDETNQIIEDLFRDEFPASLSTSISRYIPHDDQKWCRDNPDYEQQAPVLALAPPKTKTQKHNLEVDKEDDDLQGSNKKLKVDQWVNTQRLGPS